MPDTVGQGEVEAVVRHFVELERAPHLETKPAADERIGVFTFHPFTIAPMTLGALLAKSISPIGLPFRAQQTLLVQNKRQQRQPGTASNRSSQHHGLRITIPARQRSKLQDGILTNTRTKHSDSFKREARSASHRIVSLPTWNACPPSPRPLVGHAPPLGKKWTANSPKSTEPPYFGWLRNPGRFPRLVDCTLGPGTRAGIEPARQRLGPVHYPHLHT